MLLIIDKSWFINARIFKENAQKHENTQKFSQKREMKFKHMKRF